MGCIGQCSNMVEFNWGTYGTSTTPKELYLSFALAENNETRLINLKERHHGWEVFNHKQVTKWKMSLVPNNENIPEMV